MTSPQVQIILRTPSSTEVSLSVPPNLIVLNLKHRIIEALSQTSLPPLPEDFSLFLEDGEKLEGYGKLSQYQFVKKMITSSSPIVLTINPPLPKRKATNPFNNIPNLNDLNNINKNNFNNINNSNNNNLLYPNTSTPKLPTPKKNRMAVQIVSTTEQINQSSTSLSPSPSPLSTPTTSPPTSPPRRIGIESNQTSPTNNIQSHGSRINKISKINRPLGMHETDSVEEFVNLPFSKSKSSSKAFMSPPTSPLTSPRNYPPPELTISSDSVSYPTSLNSSNSYSSISLSSSSSALTTSTSSSTSSSKNLTSGSSIRHSRIYQPVVSSPTPIPLKTVTKINFGTTTTTTTSTTTSSEHSTSSSSLPTISGNVQTNDSENISSSASDSYYYNNPQRYSRTYLMSDSITSSSEQNPYRTPETSPYRPSDTSPSNISKSTVVKTSSKSISPLASSGPSPSRAGLMNSNENRRPVHIPPTNQTQQSSPVLSSSPPISSGSKISSAVRVFDEVGSRINREKQQQQQQQQLPNGGPLVSIGSSNQLLNGHMNGSDQINGKNQLLEGVVYQTDLNRKGSKIKPVVVNQFQSGSSIRRPIPPTPSSTDPNLPGKIGRTATMGSSGEKYYRLSQSVDPVKPADGTYPHSFRLTYFNSRRICDVCRGFIWGIIRYGFSCEVCKYTIHKRCLFLAPDTCSIDIMKTIEAVSAPPIEQTPVTIPSPEGIKKRQGWLWKRGFYNTQWQRRWCVLYSDRLYYYTSPDQANMTIMPRGYIPLNEVLIISTTDDRTDDFKEFPFAIYIKETSRVYHFAADSDEERQAWISQAKEKEVVQEFKTLRAPEGEILGRKISATTAFQWDDITPITAQIIDISRRSESYKNPQIKAYNVNLSNAETNYFRFVMSMVTQYHTKSVPVIRMIKPNTTQAPLFQSFPNTLRVYINFTAAITKCLHCKGEENFETILQKAISSLKGLHNISTTVSTYIIKIAGYNEYLDDFSISLDSLTYVRECVKDNQKIEFIVKDREQVYQQLGVGACVGAYGSVLEVAIKRVNEKRPIKNLNCYPISLLNKPFEFRVIGVINLSKKIYSLFDATDIETNKISLYVSCGLYFSGEKITPVVHTQLAPLSSPFWCHWLKTEIPLSNIPKESRLVFTLYGFRKPENTLINNVGDFLYGQSVQSIPLGSGNFNCFNFQGLLCSGVHDVILTPLSEPNPIDCPVSSSSSRALTLSIEIETTHYPIYYDIQPLPPSRPDFSNIPNVSDDLQAEICQLLEADVLYPLTKRDKDILWGHKEWVCKYARNSLSKVLLSAPWTEPLGVQHVHLLLEWWGPIDPLYALELLDSKFMDSRVRSYAVHCLQTLSDENLVNYMVQLIQVIKYEPYHYSLLAQFLLQRALSCELVAQSFFWNLRGEGTNGSVRYQLLLEAFILNCDPIVQEEIFRQVVLIDSLHTIVEKSKSGISTTPTPTPTPAPTPTPTSTPSPQSIPPPLSGVGSFHISSQQSIPSLTSHGSMIKINLNQNDIPTHHKLTLNSHQFQQQQQQQQQSNFGTPFGASTSELAIQSQLQNLVIDHPITLAVNPRFRVSGLRINKSRQMDSATMPLLLHFINEDNDDNKDVLVIYKVGDDLRQDSLTLQMISLMDMLWKCEGLDLHMKPYSVMPTGHYGGMIEVVKNSETTAKIQKVYGGITGAFKKTPLTEFLKEHNKNGADYKRAVENFTLSCAGYCVATYVLGIGDRHNDNIMVSTSGNFFHIDFAHFLGNVLSFGVWKRESAPFVLTPEFVHVMGGEKSENFLFFIELCCRAYNILRRNANLFLTLFSMMLSTGIPQLRRVEDLYYLREAFSLGKTEEEAASIFTKLIYESLSTKRTQINNFAHILAHPN